MDEKKNKGKKRRKGEDSDDEVNDDSAEGTYRKKIKAPKIHIRNRGARFNKARR